MKWARILFVVIVATACSHAQSTPVLHSRSESPVKQQNQFAKGHSTLPENASGEYALDGKGSVVQITIDHNELTGYVTIMDHETALTLFFERAKVDGKQVSFATKTVHGLRYRFKGSIVRGNVERTSQNGYYLLDGQLTRERNGENQFEQVSLKSTPRNPETTEQ